MAEGEVVSDENTENEAELQTILDLLIRSGQMRFLGGDTNFLRAPDLRSGPGLEPIMDRFTKNDIAYETKKASGMCPKLCPVGRNTESLTDMVMRRQIGIQKGLSFSHSDKCRINNYKLPNKMKVVDSYDHKAFCGIYSQDGKKLLTACQDRYLRIYNVGVSGSYKEVEAIAGRDVGWSILDVAFSPNASSIAYTSWSSNIHIVDISGEGNLSHRGLPLCPQERRFCIFSLQFSYYGNEILCGANDGHMYIYDMAHNRNLAYKIEAHGNDVNAISFADETSQIVYSGGDDGFCKVWDRRTLSERMPKPVGVLAGHLDGITYIDSRGDARYLISNSKDQSIKLWDIRMFSNSDAQENTKKVVGNSKWDYRWQEAPRDYTEGRKVIKGDTSIATYKGHSVLQTLIRCHFSPAFSTGQRFIYSGDAFGRLIVYDILSGKIMSRMVGHTYCVRDVSWHPYRPEIITTSWDYSVICWTHCNTDDMEDQDLECSKSSSVPERNPRRSQRLAMQHNSSSGGNHYRRLRDH